MPMVRNLAMGQNSSIPKPGRRKSLRSFSRRRRSQNQLSHTFTIVDSDDRVELLNINTATEEELMTLPGVTREVAKSVVEHRKAIGRFRRVEDLALVRGIGADKLQVLKEEICVIGKRPQSFVSSRTQSYDSLRSADSKIILKSNKLVNVNRANMFELQTIHGITQEVAASIVHYREKRGPFKQVEDLLKIPTIDRIRLNNINRYLTVELIEDDLVDSKRLSIVTNGFCATPTYEKHCNGGPFKICTFNGLPPSSVIDIFELLSAYSPRPIVEEIFNHTRNDEPAIRVALWNLHKFSFEKASNLGVKEVVCRTILENGWSILAVQEILDVATLRAICEELNKPRLRRVKEWKEANYNWNFCMLDIDDSQLGFIYKSDGAIDIELISLNQGPDDTKTDGEVLVANFYVGELNLQLVNIKLSKIAQFKELNKKMKDFIAEEDIILFFVDFSEVSTCADDWLSLGGLQPLFAPNTSTSYINLKMETSTIRHHTCNIFNNCKSQGQLTGVKGVVRRGLTHLGIPDGWSWGGPASVYCPIWTELFLKPNLGTAL